MTQLERRPFSYLNRGAVLGGILLPMSSAWAAVSVSPAAPYATYNSSVYYLNATTTPRLEPGFSNFDFTQSQAGEAGGSRPNMVRYDIASDKTFTLSGSQRLVVVVRATLSDNSKYVIPIAYAGTQDCTVGTNCQVSSLGYALAANFTQGQTLRIGFYLQDICAYVKAAGSPHYPLGCKTDNSGVFEAPAVGQSKVFYFTFSVAIAADANSLPSEADLDAEAALLNATVVNGEPDVTTSVPAEVYFPSDGAILVDTGKFAYSTTSAAPITNLIVVAQNGADADVSSNYATANDVVSRVGADGLTRAATGFTNTTDGSDYMYGVAFGVADAAGVASDPFYALGPGKVQTSSIQGFLARSSCFIATAAFRSADAAPVELLRRFRDQVLLRFAAGQSWVNWYYRWSPGAAEWLMRNPQFRAPVLFALIPLQLLAWIALHPAVALGLGAVAAAIIVLSLGRWGETR